MGIIENGTISGNFPSNETFVVHYPGYPSSISLAVETLGGIQGITTARESISNKLELRFRSEDPYSHPTCGEQSHCNGYLLKISKENVKKDPLPACVPEAITADIVSCVSESYCFERMSDYQHVVPIHADVAKQKKRKWMEVKSSEGDSSPFVGSNDLMDMADEDVMMLLPLFFAPKDMPENLVLRLPATSGQKKKDETATPNLNEIDFGPVFAIDFTVKEIPKILNWEEFLVPNSEQWQWQVTVSALFDERPVWTRNSIVQRLVDKGLKCTHHTLNRFLFRAAYYFSGGPFLRFWIKRGYDPRKDPESRVFQRMEFRVPPELKGYCDANVNNKSKLRWDEICAFKVFPLKCQTFLQLYELDDDYIQQEIRKPPMQTTCNYKTGWFSEALLDNLRLRVAVRFLSVYPENGFEDVFKSTEEEFKRSEKTRIQKDGEEDMNKCIKNTNKEKEPDVDADDEDDEKEEEDMDDEYEDADDEEISLHSQDYGDMENNSRTYLQGLFYRFPSTKPLDGSSNDGSDGEYQIYEQDDDDDDG